MNARKVVKGAAVVATLLVVWQAVVVLGHAPPWLLPAPTDVFSAATEHWSALAIGTAYTVGQAAIGFGAALVGATLCAALVSRWPTSETVVGPSLALIQSTPIIALAPLLTLWFGVGIGSKAAAAFLLSVVPICGGWLAGFRAIDPEERQLFRLWGARWSQQFRFLLLPDALPFLFAGLKVSVPLALIGSVVGEFVGAQRGIGFLILTSSYYARTPLMVAAVLILGICGVLAVAGVGAVESRVLHGRMLNGPFTSNRRLPTTSRNLVLDMQGARRR